MTRPSQILRLPTLRRDQYEIAIHPAKTKVVNMGRRWGKTTMAGGIVLTSANHGAKVAWVVPIYKNSRPLWRFAQTATAQAGKSVRLNNSERTIEFARTGGWVGIFSGDNDVGMRGENFDLVVVEEAAQLKSSTFSDVILPTLADRDGRLILISTPKGRNWYWREAMRAKADLSGEAFFITAPSRNNPNPKIQRAYDLAKAGRVSRSTFRQEWDAEFLEGEGTVFSNIALCAKIEKGLIEPYTNGVFVGGLDFAQKRDYTVLIILDAKTRRQVDMLRINKVEWKIIRQQIKGICDKWHVQTVIGEANSIGGPNIEALQDAGVPVMPFDTTPSSKSPLIESLVLAFEQEEIEVFDDPILKLELEAYEKKVNPLTGRPSYSAPSEADGEESDSDEEIHDDCVMALALAWHGIAHGLVRYAPSFLDLEPEPERPFSDDFFSSSY